MKMTVYFTDSYSIHSENDKFDFRYYVFNLVIKDIIHVTKNGDMIFSNNTVWT